MAATPWNGPLAERLRTEFPQIQETSTYREQNFAVAPPALVLSILAFLKQHEQFDYLVDITAVDYPARAASAPVAAPEQPALARFDLIYVLYSYPLNERVRVKTRIDDALQPGSFEPASAVPVFQTANWLEREVFDMFGIRFAGHPNLKRILMPEGWVGHPLRREYSIIHQDEAWVQANLHIASGQ